jgi:hypothetical protein
LFHSKFEIINSDKFDRTRTWGKNRAIAHLSLTITVEAAKIKGQSQKPKLKANDKKLKHNLLELPNPTSLSMEPL